MVLKRPSCHRTNPVTPPNNPSGNSPPGGRRVTSSVARHGGRFATRMRRQLRRRAPHATAVASLLAVASPTACVGDCVTGCDFAWSLRLGPAGCTNNCPLLSSVSSSIATRLADTAGGRQCLAFLAWVVVVGLCIFCGCGASGDLSESSLSPSLQPQYSYNNMVYSWRSIDHGYFFPIAVPLGGPFE